MFSHGFHITCSSSASISLEKEKSSVLKMGILMIYKLIQKPQKCSKEHSEQDRRSFTRNYGRQGFRFLVGNWRKAIFYTKPLHKHGDSERKNNLC